jgi:hypothetical protein
MLLDTTKPTPSFFLHTQSYVTGEGGGLKNIVCRLENTKAKAASLPRRKNALLDNVEEQRAKGKNE